MPYVAEEEEEWKQAGYKWREKGESPQEDGGRRPKEIQEHCLQNQHIPGEKSPLRLLRSPQLSGQWPARPSKNKLTVSPHMDCSSSEWCALKCNIKDQPRTRKASSINNPKIHRNKQPLRATHTMPGREDT